MLIRTGTTCLAIVATLLTLQATANAAEQIRVEDVGKDLQVVRGAVNGALLERGGKILAVYGDPRENRAGVDTVLFTHHRRDVVWAGRALVASGAKAVVPQAELAHFSEVGKFWAEFERKRFHDYAQQTTKVLTEPIPVAQSVKGGETLTWEGLPIRVLDTPGYTRGAVTYLVNSMAGAWLSPATSFTETANSLTFTACRTPFPRRRLVATMATPLAWARWSRACAPSPRSGLT